MTEGNSPAKKTAAKKVPAKRAPAKVPAEKAPAKNVGATRAPAKKAPVKKAAAKKKSASKSRLAAARKLSPTAPMSKYFKEARKRATKILDNPDELKRIADEANRTGAARGGPFVAVIDDFRTLIRLVVAYARGNYREIPPDALALVVGGLIYVVSPLDLIPDFQPPDERIVQIVCASAAPKAAV